MSVLSVDAKRNMNQAEFEEKISECAYKPYGECNQEERAVQNIELDNCSSFLRFLKWVKIIDPPKPGLTGGGVIPLMLWPHILEIVKTLLTQSLISVLKARQIGLSTIIAAYVLWYVLYHVGANVVLFSKGQPEAKELLAKSKRIYEQLPPFMKLKLDPDSTEELGFPTVNSWIKAFPSTPTASISYTASVVVADEHAAHPYAEENYIASKPIRDAGGQFISIFTEDPWTNDNLATAIFTDALEEKNDFIPLFFPWDVVPGRDNEWYEATRRNIPETEIGKVSPELYMAKNYPASIEEALSLASSIVVFDKKSLDAMREDTRSPINVSPDDYPDIDNSICNIYKDFHIGNFYIAASDVSVGVGKDYSVTVIMDVKRGEIVADIMASDLSPEDLALHSVSLLGRYHNPLWWIEENMWGRTVIAKALELNYRRLGYRDPARKHPGFMTTDKSRTDLFGTLIPAINDRQIIIHSTSGLGQFRDIIRNANRGGFIEAMSGRHDDYVIATGIAWLKKDDVKTAFDTKPIKTLHFNKKKSRAYV